MKYFIALVLLTVGCAKPNYKDEPGPNSQKVIDEGYQLDVNSLGLKVNLIFDKAPNSTDENSFTFRFHRPNDDTPVAIDQEIAIVLWMPSMGHGSSPVKIEKRSDGIYKVTKVYFIMPGDWEIRLQIKDKETSNVIEQIVQKIVI